MQKTEEHGPGDGLTEVISNAAGETIRMHTHVGGQCITMVDFDAPENASELAFALFLNMMQSLSGGGNFKLGRYLVTTVPTIGPIEMNPEPDALQWFENATDACAGHVAQVKRFLS